MGALANESRGSMLIEFETTSKLTEGSFLVDMASKVETKAMPATMKVDVQSCSALTARTFTLRPKNQPCSTSRLQICTARRSSCSKTVEHAGTRS
mmetsp:Transcript_12820/g.30073  ORF Transcript_12820/g.30073 Transcript_12820/m.30073 type:complete len:95 (+) Transcript_12820:206-490(+)